MTVRTGPTFEVRNPRTGEIDYDFASPSAAEVAAEATRLRNAQRAWRRSGLDQRIDVMRRWRAAFAAALPQITAALEIDTGRRGIAHAEAGAVLAIIDRWCQDAPGLTSSEVRSSTVMPSISYSTQYVPYELVGIISPWNFPLTLAFIDAIPALLAGAAVLIKPSEVTPRWIVPVARTIASVPELAAVLHVEAGGRDAGETVVRESSVVCFTGSVRTGRLVAENAARHFVPVFLELGGKDPVIVTATADLDRAAATVLRASCSATGQACQSLERVYVDRKVVDAFVERLVARAEQVGINWPDIERGAVGPFIFAPQAETVAAQLADARRKGARVLTGGEIIDHGGKWMRPTVLVDVDHTMDIMTEETFGPVMPVIAWDTREEAIALANDSIYGLSAAVMAGTLEEAEAIAVELDVGAVSLNDGSLTAIFYEAEKHSFKLSGMGGSRMGPAGYTRFLRKKALLRQAGEPAKI